MLNSHRTHGFSPLTPKLPHKCLSRKTPPVAISQQNHHFQNPTVDISHIFRPSRQKTVDISQQNDTFQAKKSHATSSPHLKTFILPAILKNRLTPPPSLRAPAPFPTP